MKKKFTEISFVNSQTKRNAFDLITYEEVLKKKPSDHSQFDFHKISFYVILLITDSKGKYNLNFKDYDFKKGSLFTVRRDNIHKFYKNNAKGQLIVFTENFILNHSNKKEASRTFLLFNEMLASPKLQLNKKEFNEIVSLLDLIKEEYYHANDDYSMNIIRNYIQVLITKLFRIKSKDSIVFDSDKYLSLFLQLQQLVEEECFNYKKVSYYAKHLGITTKTLNNVTQSIIHKTAKTFINEIVIIHSKRLIINSTNSLTEIAYQVGFDDPTNFFKYFKKYTGITPSQFKSSCHFD